MSDAAEVMTEVPKEHSIDMDAAMDQISNDLFPPEPEPKDEEFDVVETVVEEVEEPKEEPEDGLQKAKEEEQVEEYTGKAAPDSWKKEMHEFWKGLDPAVQDYVQLREDQMKEGLEKDRGDANLGRTMRDVMAPYSQILQQQGIDEPILIRNLMNAHYRLSTASPEEKVQLMNQLARGYGVSLDGQPQDVDPALKALQDRLNGLEYTLQSSHERSLQESRTRVATEVEQFASEHEHFDEVSDQMVPLINAGYSLEDAYKSAIWLNPVTRQKELERTSTEAAEKAAEEAKKEAQKAQKAKSANVRTRDTRRAPQEPTGSIDDTLRETYLEIQNRSD